MMKLFYYRSAAIPQSDVEAFARAPTSWKQPNTTPLEGDAK